MKTKNNRKKIFQNARRIVVKIGSNVLTQNKGLNLDLIDAISGQIIKLNQRDCEVILVSSGAVASGMKRLKLKKKPEKIPEKQAAAAIGQAGLILEYEKAFTRYNKNVAQILLTPNDFRSNERYNNAKNTLNTLLSWNVLPIINENDTVVVGELKFGDNDNLAAMIAISHRADILINLTDIDGLYDSDPRLNKDAKIIPEVSRVGKKIEQLASGVPGAVGTGGMLSKILAAKKTIRAGVPMIIASGKEADILIDLYDGREKGTFFIPNAKRMEDRKNWLAFSAKPVGIIRIDKGAKEALIQNGKSLLPSGIIDVEKKFNKKDPVELRDEEDRIIGVGLSNYTSDEIVLIKGKNSDYIANILDIKPVKKNKKRSYEEVIHRNNFVVTYESVNK